MRLEIAGMQASPASLRWLAGGWPWVRFGDTLASVEMVYRLDMGIDLFATVVAGMPVVVDDAELEAIREAIAEVQRCWSVATEEQLRLAVVRAIGRDPRE
jgi:hypothetical protein